METTRALPTKDTDFHAEETYIHDSPPEISPCGTWLETQSVAFDALPEPVRATFQLIIDANPINPEWDVEGDDDEEGDAPHVDVGEDITYAQVMGGAQGIYQLGIHDAGSPVNPSGYDYYVRADGSYIGHTES
jgi:hypothetical protein